MFLSSWFQTAKKREKWLRRSKQVFEDPKFLEAYEKTGAPVEVIKYGDREVCTEYALSMVEFAQRYSEILSAEKG